MANWCLAAKRLRASFKMESLSVRWRVRPWGIAYSAHSGKHKQYPRSLAGGWPTNEIDCRRSHCQAAISSGTKSRLELLLLCRARFAPIVRRGLATRLLETSMARPLSTTAALRGVSALVAGARRAGDGHRGTWLGALAVAGSAVAACTAQCASEDAVKAAAPTEDPLPRATHAAAAGPPAALSAAASNLQLLQNARRWGALGVLQCDREAPPRPAAGRAFARSSPAPARAPRTPEGHAAARLLASCQERPADASIGWTGPDLMVNWSGTESARAGRSYLPESTAQVAAVLAEHHAANAPVRPIGSSISPNGIGLPTDGGSSISIALMDKVLAVDRDERTVTVQAGARVQAVVDALAELGLSLENYASIAEQQMGGFTQVSAHGTGALVPPVDDQVLALTLVTAEGAVLRLRADAETEAERRLFRLARVGLGALGVVTEMTLRVVPRHLLREVTWIISRKDACDPTLNAAMIRRHRHVRYMWVPYTDDVIVVASDAVATDPRAGPRAPHLRVDGAAALPAAGLADGKDGDLSLSDATKTAPPGPWPAAGSAEATAAADLEQWAKQPLRELLAELSGEAHAQAGQASLAADVAALHARQGDADPGREGTLRERAARLTEAAEAATAGDVASLSAAGLRHRLLGFGPLDTGLVRKVNLAEARYYRRACGQERGGPAGPEAHQGALPPGVPAGARVRFDWSDRVLGFDCGGAQWVNEVALPAGSWAAPDSRGSDFVRRILEDVVERRGLPAPSPIEQRWTAATPSPMSPAAAQRWARDGSAAPTDAIFSWVGIIQYMPREDDARQRASVTAAFKSDYEAVCRRELWADFRAAQHWAKIDLDGLAPDERREALESLAADYDLEAFEDARAVLDPRGILVGPRLASTVLAAAPLAKLARA